MKNDLEDGWQSFLRICKEVKNLDQLDELLNFFLTIEEKQNLATRYLLIQGLLKGKKTQRELSKELRVSIAKITRGSNALKIISDPLRGFLERKMT